MGEGGFATVFAATDTLLGIKVALKIPHSSHVTQDLMDEFRREARLTMQLDHPNILPIRDASMIDGHFTIVSPLANGTLEDRMTKRFGFSTAFGIVTQLIEAVAYAHDMNVIHCDIKPENILLFDDNHIRLGDFGIAKAANKTISAAGTGTVGYMAPDQAMGRPSKSSDVFSIGLIAYRLFSGVWPEYPFEWPMAGASRLRRRAHPDLIALIRKSVSYAPRHRYRDASAMLKDWEKTRLKAMRFAQRR